MTLKSPHGSTRDFYLGRHGSEDSRQRYQALIAKWFAMGRQLPAADLTVAGDLPLSIEDLSIRYREWANGYYRHPDGSSTGESENVGRATHFLDDFAGKLHPGDFTPNRLRDLQQVLVRRNLSRTYINASIRRIRSMFKWAEAREWVPAATYARLQTVEMLKAGRSAAREPKGLGPVDDATVAATLPFLSRPLAGIVRLVLATGARCGEVVQIASRHVDMTGDVWVFRPPQHKTRHHGQSRAIFIGQQGQDVLRPFVQLDPDRRWFRPCDAEAERQGQRRRQRRTPLYPSHVRHMERKRKVDPKKVPGDAYETKAVTHAIREACRRAGISPAWSVHRLRHAALGRIRAQYGIEAAAAVAGHSVLAMTDHYTSTLRERLARDIVGKLG